MNYKFLLEYFISRFSVKLILLVFHHQKYWNFLNFPSKHLTLRRTVWNSEKTVITHKKIREINSLVTFFVRTLIWRKNVNLSVKSWSRSTHCVKKLYLKVHSDQKNISWSQLFSNFFSKTVVSQNFCRKSVRVNFHSVPRGLEMKLLKFFVESQCEHIMIFLAFEILLQFNFAEFRGLQNAYFSKFDFGIFNLT